MNSEPPKKQKTIEGIGCGGLQRSERAFPPVSAGTYRKLLKTRLRRRAARIMVRHTFGTILRAPGFSFEDVQLIVGTAVG